MSTDDEPYRLPDLEAIYRLSDLELAKSLYAFSNSPYAERFLRSKWEREFARGAVESYVKSDKLTWKQRKAARQILGRFLAEVKRRDEVQTDS